MSKTGTKYLIGPMNCIVEENGKFVSKPTYDKNGQIVNKRIQIKGPEELEKEGYIVINAEPTVSRGQDR